MALRCRRWEPTVAAIESGAEQIDADLVAKIATLPCGKERSRAVG